MKIITSDTEPNSQCSWAPDLGIRDDSRPQLGDLRQLAGKMQNSKPVIEYRRGSPNLQLSGQDHHSDQQVPFMCGIQCLWENLQVLLEMQNTLHPLHISLQQSYMDLTPSCSLFLRMFVGFFSRWPRFNTKWKKHSPPLPLFGILENSQRQELGIGQAQPPRFVCQWRSLPLEQCTWQLLPVFVVSKAAVFVFICLQTLCVSNISVRLGFSHDCGGLKVLVCLSQVE